MQTKAAKIFLKKCIGSNIRDNNNNTTNATTLYYSIYNAHEWLVNEKSSSQQCPFGPFNYPTKSYDILSLEYLDF